MARRGSAAVLLVLVALVALGLATYVFLAGGGATGPAPDVERGDVVTGTGEGDMAPVTGEGGLDGVDPRGPAPLTNVEIGASPLAGLERSFDGVATLRGDVRVESGAFPETWTLHIEPSRHGQARSRAETRIVEAEPGMRDFEERDLPMATYRVSARAPGLASREQEVTLCRFVGHGAIDEAHVDIVLRPLPSVVGSVRMVNGDVAEGLPMTLVERRMPGEEGDVERFEVETDTVGSYRFEGVRPGVWLLHVGGELQGFVAPLPVAVDLADVSLDDVTLPPLATLELVVLDDFGRPFPDVEVTGYLRGDGKGSFRTVSDAVGGVKVPYLTPGTWRVEGRYVPQGQSGRIDVAIGALPSETPLQLYVR